MSDFDLKFDLQTYYELDQFALLARQNYNFGNASDWFGSFRGGLYGSYARILGITIHYYDVHSWKPRLRLPRETEYHLASIFFNMDSLVECITFALNALGFCASNNDSFRDVTKSKELERISRYDITGRKETNSSKRPLAGYEKVFPSVQKYWKDHYKMLCTIFEQHDVSKHRETIFCGGMLRNDPPPGFFESLDISENAPNNTLYGPSKEIILRYKPKTPRVERVSRPREDLELLENLVPNFRDFILETGIRALDDAKCNIKLKVNELRGK